MQTAKNLFVGLACALFLYKICCWLKKMSGSTDSAGAAPEGKLKNKGPHKATCKNNNNNNNNNGNSGTVIKRKEPTKANLSRKQAGSNWENAKFAAGGPSCNGAVEEQKTARKKVKQHPRHLTKYVAMDCEMVGIGENGQKDMLARVSIVNQKGAVLLDKFVKPTQRVVDYRTQVSGIRPHDMENGEDFGKVQDEVVNILQDRILVGHSVHNDLAVLYLEHPGKNIRDTAKYKPLAKLVANGATPSLKRLAKAILGIDIQDGEHNSVEDARATMSIYNRVCVDWENYIKRKFYSHRHRSGRSRS